MTGRSCEFSKFIATGPIYYGSLSSKRNPSALPGKAWPLRLWELTQDSAADNAELESLEAIVYARLLQTYGDGVTAPLPA